MGETTKEYFNRLKKIITEMENEETEKASNTIGIKLIDKMLEDQKKEHPSRYALNEIEVTLWKELVNYYSDICFGFVFEKTYYTVMLAKGLKQFIEDNPVKGSVKLLDRIEETKLYYRSDIIYKKNNECLKKLIGITRSFKKSIVDLEPDSKGIYWQKYEKRNEIIFNAIKELKKHSEENCLYEQFSKIESAEINAQIQLNNGIIKPRVAFKRNGWFKEINVLKYDSELLARKDFFKIPSFTTAEISRNNFKNNFGIIQEQASFYIEELLPLAEKTIQQRKALIELIENRKQDRIDKEDETIVR